jgi:uncharacterized protein (TIGR02147 family)
MMPNIYEYIDYRKFLRDLIAEKKIANSGYSCRVLASRLGISAATLVRILNGKRNLSKKLLPKFVEYLKLRERSAEYLRLLVQLAHVKGPEKKNAIYQKILDFRSERIKKVLPQHYSIFEDWYIGALRELIDIKGKFINVKSLVDDLRIPITLREAEKAISVLKNSGLIQQKENNNFYATEKLLTTGEKWESIAIQRYQKEMIRLSENALMNFSKDERDISTLTIGLSEDGIYRAKEIIRRARQEILAIAEETKRQYVYQLNFQFFPLTKCIKKREI